MVLAPTESTACCGWGRDARRVSCRTTQAVSAFTLASTTAWSAHLGGILARKNCLQSRYQTFTNSVEHSCSQISKCSDVPY
eukprot:4125122-Pyramimonas_sp.AAC.1